MRSFLSILVLQLSLWGRESWLLCFVCLPGVSLLLCGSSSRCHGFYSLWLWYFLIILTIFESRPSVTIDGANLTTVNILLLNGKTPYTSNLYVILDGCAAFGQDSLAIPGKSWIGFCFSWVISNQLSWAILTYFLKGPTTVWSSGCNVWKQWDGNNNIIIPFAIVKFSVSIPRWEWWLSKRSRTGFSVEGLACLAEYFMKTKMFSVVIQTGGFVTPTQPVGPSRIKWSSKFCLGKINIGGTELPIADTATHMVTSEPLSPDVTELICLSPSAATMFLSFFNTTLSGLVNVPNLSWS